MQTPYLRLGEALTDTPFRPYTNRSKGPEGAKLAVLKLGAPPENEGGQDPENCVHRNRRQGEPS